MEAWYWTHDGTPEQVNTGVSAVFRLVRVSSYGAGRMRRLATLWHKDPGPPRELRADLDELELAVCRDAVSVTAGEDGRWSVVVEPGLSATSSVRTGLDEAQVRALLEAGHGIVDLDVYPTARGRRYAVVAGLGTGAPQWLLTGVTKGELRRGLRRLRASPLRLRAHTGAEEGRYTALAGPAFGADWHVDLTGDQVGRRLDHSRIYPSDLDAIRTAAGVRFTVVIRK